MKKIALSLVLLSLAMPLARAQSDNTIHVKTFGGVDVGSKIANAMATCPAAPVPCILAVDASLAAFPAGTTPSLCANCYLQDFRNGPATGPNSALAVDALTGYRHIDTCGQTGADWGIRAAAATSFAIAQGWQGAIIDASCEPHNAANLSGGSISLITATNPFQPVVTLCGSTIACTLFNEVLLLAPGVWTTNTSIVVPSLTTLDGQSSMGSATGNVTTMGGTVLAEGSSFPSGIPLIQYGYPTGTAGNLTAQAIHVRNLSLWGKANFTAGNDGIYNAFCQDRCDAANLLIAGFNTCIDLESESTSGGAMNSGPWSPLQCDIEGSSSTAYAIRIGATPLSGSLSMGAAPLDLGPRIEAIGTGDGLMPTTPAIDLESGTIHAGEIYIEGWGTYGFLANQLHSGLGGSFDIDLLECNGSKYAFFACAAPNHGGVGGNSTLQGGHFGSVIADNATFSVFDECGACGTVRIENGGPKLNFGSYGRAGYNVQRSDITAVLHSYFNCSTGAAPAVYELATLNAGCANTIGGAQTTGILGIFVSGTDQFALHRSYVASGGMFPCDFGSTGTVTAGDYVTVASGKCSDNGTTIPATAFRGVIQQTEAATSYATPATPGCSAHTSGSTTFTYKVTIQNALDASESAASAACSVTATGPLSSGNPNTITGLTCSLTIPCNVYETAGSGGVGWIGPAYGSSFVDIGYQADTARTAPGAIRLAPYVDILGTL